MNFDEWHCEWRRYWQPAGRRRLLGEHFLTQICQATVPACWVVTWAKVLRQNIQDDSDHSLYTQHQNNENILLIAIAYTIYTGNDCLVIK